MREAIEGILVIGSAFGASVLVQQAYTWLVG